jgi:hypothetical protein
MGWLSEINISDEIAGIAHRHPIIMLATLLLCLMTFLGGASGYLPDAKTPEVWAKVAISLAQ